MPPEPRLLDRLASLTAIKDLELIEFSLLKTLKEFLKPRGLGLIRLNNIGQASMEIVYGDDEFSMRNEAIVLSPAIQTADDFLRTSDAHFYSTPTDQGLLAIFPLVTSRDGRSYMQFWVDEELTEMDHHMVAGVLQIYRNFVGVIKHSQTDQLTGLANRKTFDDCVARVHELIPIESDPVGTERRKVDHMDFWLVMVDIDHFKSVNDRFGHLYGDEVLVIMAQLMQASFRESDLIFRFGGEEFVLILKCADQTACQALLERFRQAVEQRSIPQVGGITISMGVTLMERETFAATMVDQADQALYHSKHNGRNRVTFFEELLEQGLASVKSLPTDEASFF